MAKMLQSEPRASFQQIVVRTPHVSSVSDRR